MSRYDFESDKSKFEEYAKNQSKNTLSSNDLTVIEINGEFLPVYSYPPAWWYMGLRNNYDKDVLLSKLLDVDVGLIDVDDTINKLYNIWGIKHNG